jgi:hypothetical protein
MAYITIINLQGGYGYQEPHTETIAGKEKRLWCVQSISLLELVDVRSINLGEKEDVQLINPREGAARSISPTAKVVVQLTNLKTLAVL